MKRNNVDLLLTMTSFVILCVSIEINQNEETTHRNHKAQENAEPFRNQPQLKCVTKSKEKLQDIRQKIDEYLTSHTVMFKMVCVSVCVRERATKLSKKTAKIKMD